LPRRRSMRREFSTRRLRDSGCQLNHQDKRATKCRTARSEETASIV
jgi:hypothetical protein